MLIWLLSWQVLASGIFKFWFYHTKYIVQHDVYMQLSSTPYIYICGQGINITLQTETAASDMKSPPTGK